MQLYTFIHLFRDVLCCLSGSTKIHKQSTRTPASAQPRISDPMLIQSTIQRVAYYADKLNQLHNEYRRCYAEQQQLSQQLNNLKSQCVDPTDYHNRSNAIQSQIYNINGNLRHFLSGIYEQFTKMKQALDTRYELQLDATSRQHFQRLSRYYDQFKTSQHHILAFAQQQQQQQQQQQAQTAYYQQQQQQQQQAPQQTGYNMNIPPTPHYYQDRVQNTSGYHEQKLQHNHHLSAAINSMTPRNHGGSYQYHPMTNNQYGYPKANTTTALDDKRKRFMWGPQAQSQQKLQQIQPSRTPRPMPSRQINQQNGGQNNQLNNSNNNNNNNKKNGDIPNMGYVYIGARITQLQSHIGLNDQEMEQHQKRIEMAIESVLKNDQHFIGFDIVCYGSSAHKLFIKDYSDFDYCIRCKKLSISHCEAIEYIATAIMETNKNDFEFDFNENGMGILESKVYHRMKVIDYDYCC